MRCYNSPKQLYNHRSCAQINAQNLCFAGSPKMHILLCKGGVGINSTALADCLSWREQLLPPAPVSKRMLLLPAPVSESLVSPLYNKKLALANWGGQQEHALATCSTFSEQKMHLGELVKRKFCSFLCAHMSDGHIIVQPCFNFSSSSFDTKFGWLKSHDTVPLSGLCNFF